MKKTIKSNLKIDLIAIGMLFLIPITVNLGINFIYPKISWQTLHNSQQKFIEEHMPHYDAYTKMIKSSDINQEAEQQELFKEYNQYVTQWKKSDQYKDLKNEESKQQQFKFVALALIILLLLTLLNFVHFPTIAAALIGSILYLYISELNDWSFSFDAPITDGSLCNIPLPVIGIITSCICLSATLYYAHRKL